MLLTLGARAHEIPKEEQDRQKIYYGSPTSFEKPAEVGFVEVIEATPEYTEIKKKKIKRGTGKYWILMSRASDRAVRTIAKVGEETEYDFIAARGYLGSLKQPISADDITKDVIKALDKEEEGKK